MSEDRTGRLMIAAGLFCVAWLTLTAFVFPPVPAMGQPNADARAELAQYGARIAAGELEVATFGSGCFWCTETDFDSVEGVVATISGYMGGAVETGTYEQVSRGGTDHIEVLHIVYAPTRVTYESLLQRYWRTTDILAGGGQFCDRGPQYRPVIFAHGRAQEAAARRQKAKLETEGEFDRPIAVQIREASVFVPAEDYHQNYAAKNPLRYKSYRYGCGRDQRLDRLWSGKSLSF